MVAAAMEAKRLGLCQKSLFVVPNHLTEQWASEFLRLYPSANILVTTKKDFETHNRKKFCARIATGDYDAIIMDPPSYGRGPKGEIWKIEESVYPLIQLCSQILTDNPLFFLINSYTTGLQPAVLSYMISTVLGTANGTVTASEIGLPVSSNGLVLPCGASGRYEATGI